MNFSAIFLWAPGIFALSCAIVSFGQEPPAKDGDIEALQNAMSRLASNQVPTTEDYRATAMAAAKIMNEKRANFMDIDIERLTNSCTTLFSTKPALESASLDLTAKLDLARLLCGTVHTKMNRNPPLGQESEHAVAALFLLCRTWTSDADALKKEVDAGANLRSFAGQGVPDNDQSPEAMELRKEFALSQRHISRQRRLANLNFDLNEVAQSISYFLNRASKVDSAWFERVKADSSLSQDRMDALLNWKAFRKANNYANFRWNRDPEAGRKMFPGN